MKWFFKCFKQYADFSGRARRSEFWWFMVINFIISVVLFIGWIIPIFKIAFNAGYNGDEYYGDEWRIVRTVLGSPFLWIYIIYQLAVLIPSIAVTVRRLHDIGKSGFWYFLFIGPSIVMNYLSMISQANPNSNMLIYVSLLLPSLAIFIIYLVWMFTNSEYGPNQYGLNPKGEGNPTEEVPTTTE